MGEHDRSDLLFAIAQGTLIWKNWKPTFGANQRKLAYPAFILCAGMPRRMDRNMDARVSNMSFANVCARWATHWALPRISSFLLL